ncbi:MAG: carbohydrate-binding family 9-like protein [Trueperaceae bacterium]|nr:carbohydrate-binding family 9-like protein [Trueperaceae bacterium]
MSFPCPEDQLPSYTAYYLSEPLTIDGHLDKPAWQNAPRSARFRDLVSGAETLFDTRVSLLWDEAYLYVAYWVEEPFVEASLLEQDALIYQDNDVELFIAGPDAYYELEINAHGTIYEVFFIWQDAYERSRYSQIPEFALECEGVRPFDGVGFKHSRGKRIGFWSWDFPGLKKAVFIDGSLNDNSDRDRGWTVELALPWSGMKHLASGRSLPPDEGDIWRMDFSRFNQYKEAAPAADSGGWALSPHYVWDSHVPECFAKVQFSRESVYSANRG